MIKRSETELRKLFKDAFSYSLLFVEYGYGGTDGISDCILMIDEEYTRPFCAFIELKRDRNSDVRPSQRKFFKRALSYGQPVLLVRWQTDESIEILKLGLKFERVVATKSVRSNRDSISLRKRIYEILSIQQTVH